MSTHAYHSSGYHSVVQIDKKKKKREKSTIRERLCKKGKRKLLLEEHVISSVTESITPHAWKRMSQRAVSLNAIAITMVCGSMYYALGAEIFVIGKKECSHSKFDLTPYRGVHVVFSDGKIITTYVNKELQLRYRR